MVKVARIKDEQRHRGWKSEGWLSDGNKGFPFKMAEGKMLKSSWGADGVGPSFHNALGMESLDFILKATGSH